MKKHTIELIPIIYDECYNDTFAYEIINNNLDVAINKATELAIKDYGKSASKKGFKILDITTIDI